MSILSGLKDKFKKEVVDKLAEAVKNEAEKNRQEAAGDFGNVNIGTVIGGGVPSGTIIGGGSAVPQGEYHEKSWYMDVPAEECQYNFKGTYLEYFDMIFREDFPGYEIAFEQIQVRRRYKYTFRRDGGEKLVVELMASSCESQKLRRDCLSAGVPYLRFYFDHNGWWNTRTYVRDRVSRTLAD